MKQIEEIGELQENEISLSSEKQEEVPPETPSEHKIKVGRALYV